jgi:hypothetical protein
VFSQSVTGVTQDPALPALAEVLNTERLMPLLGEAAALDLRDRKGLSCVAQVLSHKLGQRCTIRFTLARTSPRKRARCLAMIIGKIYGRQRLAERQYCRTRDLRNGPFNDGGPLCVPTPLMLVRDLGLVLQQYVPGTDLRTVLTTGETDRPLTLVGHWLARMHTTPALTGLKISLLQHELERVGQWCEYIAPCLPTADAQRLGRAQETLHRVASAIVPVTPVMIHKDFYFGNILWDGRRICVLDFDELSIGDPALDVGHFLAHLEALAYRSMKQVDAFDQKTAPFLRSYQAKTSLDIESRLPFYRAYTFLKLAATEASRKNQKWERITRMLARLACRVAEHQESTVRRNVSLVVASR